ncbi:hypothetical protein HNQ91_002967 [Filimonas zeae]|uniref:KAP NTPase domain-containing protein n=1 Tax=Filimonas zeae TaxID=1737353 RepID=A0A917MWG7_9BACT|nr:P-loop NTPase fold protein [Filimonas zeae]MDR6339902.1 hypothetical protein [Filimonas zeae]GGH70225.1 hypothetical protein GCM10011379_28270 [Filimonas zeae]
MISNYFKEVFQYSISDFKSHIEDIDNERIIFSGRYGSGKTTFLNDYFNQIDAKEEYDVYKLYPVNYSIASNEDIFSYIKYDLIFELLKSGVEVQKMDFAFLQALPWFVLKNPVKVLAGIIKMIPKVGKEINEYYTGLKELYDEIEKYRKNEEHEGLERLAEYLETLEDKEGGLYENDLITKCISSIILQKAKLGTEDGREKKTVLIVDDLDRLDPEHIFRILNVFAAHFETASKTGINNKFGFDKVVIVCDINNIRNIFSHRHGSLVDFMGYIDKFYSSDIFHFDSRLAVSEILQKVFSTFLYSKELNSYNIQLRRTLVFGNEFLKEISILMINKGWINLRTIMKMYGKTILYTEDTIRFSREAPNVSVLKLSLIVQLRILRDMFGDFANMASCFEKCQNENTQFENYDNNIVGFFFILCNESQHHFSRKKIFELTFEGKNYKIDYQEDFNTDYIKQVSIKSSPENGSETDIFWADLSLFWNLLNKSIHALHNLGYLK